VRQKATIRTFDRVHYESVWNDTGLSKIVLLRHFLRLNISNILSFTILCNGTGEICLWRQENACRSCDANGIVWLRRRRRESVKNHSFFLSSAWRIIHFFFLQPEESFIFSFNRKRQPTIWRCPNDVGTFSAQTSVARQAATRFHPRFKVTRRFPSLQAMAMMHWCRSKN